MLFPIFKSVLIFQVLCLEGFAYELFPSMRERLPNQFPDPSTVKYSEISISFNGTRTNKLCAIRKRWLKTHCGAVDGKNIPLERQPLKNFIQKFCSSYSEDKHWEDPHSPIFVKEIPLAVQSALPPLLQVAVWPIGPVKRDRARGCADPFSLAYR